ncbi:MAG TPA: ABC-2 family transporter protein [Chthoniobacteraceae bacterium]|jgi:ABC-2 type transport system permease protein|nr:ABC-2 family transporter protein [Chthoniobacteraceae bacterium]
MRRYFEIYRIMLRNSVIREMSFKANFILWMAVELLWFLGQILFIEVLFQYVDRIGEWTKWEVVLLIGTHQLIGQIFQAFFYVNVANLPELVRTGKLDFMLLLPVDSQFAVSTRQFGMDNVVNALVGVGIVIFALVKMHVTPTAWQVAMYIPAVALGVAVHYSIMFFLATISFWIVRAQGLIYGYYNLFNIARYPDSIFGRGIFRFVFSWIIPVIVVANVPARVLGGLFESPLPLLARLAGAALVAVVLSRAFWHFALRRYSSASS